VFVCLAPGHDQTTHSPGAIMPYAYAVRPASPPHTHTPTPCVSRSAADRRCSRVGRRRGRGVACLHSSVHVAVFKVRSRGLQKANRHNTPSIISPKPQTTNHKPYTLNHKPQPQTKNHKSQTQSETSKQVANVRTGRSSGRHGGNCKYKCHESEPDGCTGTPRRLLPSAVHAQPRSLNLTPNTLNPKP